MSFNYDSGEYISRRAPSRSRCIRTSAPADVAYIKKQNIYIDMYLNDSLFEIPLKVETTVRNSLKKRNREEERTNDCNRNVCSSGWKGLTEGLKRCPGRGFRDPEKRRCRWDVEIVTPRWRVFDGKLHKLFVVILHQFPPPTTSWSYILLLYYILLLKRHGINFFSEDTGFWRQDFFNLQSTK